MIKVTILKENVMTNQGTFKTQEEAEAWIAEGVANNWWGLPERQELDEMGMETEVTLPAEYEIVTEDMTVQLALLAEQEEAKALLAATDWYIIREMDTGTPCPEDVKQARAAARAKL